MKFEHTSLMRHPTVEKAFSVIQEMAQKAGLDDAHLQRSIRAAEIVSQYANKPDPDMLAAAMLIEGITNRYDVEVIAEGISPRAAVCYNWIYELDTKEPVLEEMGQRQICLGYATRILELLQMTACESYADYGRIKKTLADCESLVLAAMTKTEDVRLLEVALTKFMAVRDGLEGELTKRQEAWRFESTGLPDHPTVRGVYEYIKAETFRNDPFGGALAIYVGIAKTVLETGASRDPDVIAVAMLHRMYRSPAEIVELERMFSPRIAALYDAASLWGSFHKSSRPLAEEVLVLTHARETYMLEDMINDCSALVRGTDHYSRSSLVLQLERIESLREDVAIDISEQKHPALKARMEAAVNMADRFIREPHTVKIRKPGSPPIDPSYGI